MSRLYRAVAIAPVQAGGFSITLDGRPVPTPARRPLVVPGRSLAAAIAEEWNAQGNRVDPRSMPLTGLANAALDRVAPDTEAFASDLVAYGGSDLLCYRAEGPPRLVERQAQAWDPILAWARSRYGIELVTTCGVVHRAQPIASIDRLAQAMRSRDAFALAALSSLVALSGSILIALALAEGAIGIDAAWSAATVDERWQAETWGEDAEAVAALVARRSDFDAAARFLALLGS